METKTMNTYVIEREMPNSGQLNAAELQEVSKASCAVLQGLGPGIQWLHSYVADDKIFCIYKAENEEILKEHARRGGFPINTVYKLSTIISPETATTKLDPVIENS